MSRLTCGSTPSGRLCGTTARSVPPFCQNAELEHGDDRGSRPQQGGHERTVREPDRRALVGLDRRERSSGTNARGGRWETDRRVKDTRLMTGSCRCGGGFLLSWPVCECLSGRVHLATELSAEHHDREIVVQTGSGDPFHSQSGNKSEPEPRQVVHYIGTLAASVQTWSDELE